jgi:hypothetical protein
MKFLENLAASCTFGMSQRTRAVESGLLLLTYITTGDVTLLPRRDHWADRLALKNQSP